jgi:hypothetical protein
VKKFALAFVLMLTLGVMAMPAGAKQIELIGPTISPLTGHPTTFAAGAPFHVANCWLIPSTSDAIGKFRIALEVDGTAVAGEPLFSTTSGDPDIHNRCWVWNFPDGLSAGTHTFVQNWYAPCYATAQACTNPNELVVAASYTLTVTFS